MLLRIDLRLVEAQAELFALKDYLKLLEEQITDCREKAKHKFEEELEKQKSKKDYSVEGYNKWQLIHQEYWDRIDRFLPRFFRGPFLVALYAVYESVVTEISKEIQEKQKLPIKIDEIRGDCLESAKKFFKQVPSLDLCKENETWQHIQMLSELRNAVAHANSRFKMLKRPARDKIKKWAKGGKGIDIGSGYVIVEAELLEKLFKVVRSSLQSLIERYKDWDDSVSSVK